MTTEEGSNNNDDLHLKEQQQQLSAVIKGLHKQLRRAYRENAEDHDSVWERHTQDSASLQRYATAMHHLATQHWAAHPDTRIQWCRQVALEYFTGGGMRHALEKDLKRRIRRNLPNMSDQRDQNVNQSGNLKLSTDQTEQMSPKSDFPEAEYKKNLEIIRNEKMSIPPVKGRLRLLDVGSCYNPFLDFPEFESIGIDLSPATQNVYQCDFLKVQLTPRLSHVSSLDDLDPTSLASTLGISVDPSSNPVTELPRSSFQVVVFSLLLEYLPAPTQRWMCCVKAHSLLVPHGLLLIITPDSNSANRNAPMMKSWRQALEHLGFSRWKYHKMEHVHCMAFRKINDEISESIPESVENLLYIPQDFNNACYDDDHLPPSERNSHPVVVNDHEHQEELEAFLLSSAEELPLCCLEDESDDS